MIRLHPTCVKIIKAWHILGKNATSREITDEIHHSSEYIVSKMMHFIEGLDRFPFSNIDTSEHKS